MLNIIEEYRQATGKEPSENMLIFLLLFEYAVKIADREVEPAHV